MESFFPIKSSQIMSSGLSPLEYPCNTHKGEICLNYCVDSPCFRPLCSECIEEHLIQHKENGQSDLYIKSLKGVRADCLIKLGRLIEELLGKIGGITPLQNP